MISKKHFFFLIFLAVLLCNIVNAESGLELYSGQKASLRFTYLALGFCIYQGLPESGLADPYFWRFHEADITFEYRPWQLLGIAVYTDFKGYFYTDDDGGYQDSDIAFVRFWGDPNFSIGAGAVLHIPVQKSNLDLNAMLGLEYVHYFAGAIDFFPGIGLTAKGAASWKLSSHFGLGFNIAFHSSYHKGGPYPSDSSRTRLPFILYELAGGPSFTLSF
ncbi:MAG: hypothetical protein JW874_04010 [Spirochaetales bacterium]|nr:hypothetical protein [Spirochaetales bacterium]